MFWLCGLAFLSACRRARSLRRTRVRTVALLARGMRGVGLSHIGAASFITTQR